jgi:hypothetical protein
MSGNLCLHSGAKIIDVEALPAVITPEATKTWTPIPHHTFVDGVRDAMVQSGAIIESEEHSLYKDGARYFGLFHLRGEDGGNTVIGLRNSHDKTFPAALAMGHRVFVCDNLSFCGDVVLRRKHTRFIVRDLPELIYRAVSELADFRGLQAQRLAAYGDNEITDIQAHDLIIRALLARVVSGEAVPKVVQEWREPSHDEFQPRTVWSLFNAFTEVMKGTAPMAMVKRTVALHGLCDVHCGVAV